MKKIAIYLATVMFLGISCSEEVTVNPELAGPLYGLTKGEPGSVDECFPGEQLERYFYEMVYAHEIGV